MKLMNRLSTVAEDCVPGTSSLEALNDFKFPWKDLVDGIQEVSSKDAFPTSLELCRGGGLLCGPSSGFNLISCLSFHLAGKASANRLEGLF